MSETVTAVTPTPEAIAIAEHKLVARLAAMARDPAVDPERVRTSLESLPPADVVPMSDRVADLLRLQAKRSGNYETLERALPYLPGQEARERERLERDALLAQQPTLTGDAAMIAKALARVFDEMQPAAAADLNAYTKIALADREREHGPIVLTETMRRQAERASLDIPPPPAPAREELGIVLTRRGVDAPSGTGIPPSADPVALPGYVVKEVRTGHEYFQEDDGQLAVRTDAQRIQGVLRDHRTISAILDIAAARGWNEVQIAGDLAIQRDTWVEAVARGFKAEGYAPTRDDLRAVQQRIAERREQGLSAGEVTPQMQRAAERAEQTPAPERAPSQVAPTPNLDRAPPPPPDRTAKDPWMTRTDGFGGLPSHMQASAVRSYERWVARNPEKNVDGLHNYVGHVQTRQAEERERLAMPPPKIETPRRTMRM